MLVLSRLTNQAIVLDVPEGCGPCTIAIEVVEVREGKVRLGVSAPRRVTIDREEIAERKRRTA